LRIAESSTCKDFLQVQKEGLRMVERNQKFYNLDAIISVGYRIKSSVATRFRKWATQHIREYIVKGFVMDDERLKNPNQAFDYFDELWGIQKRVNKESKTDISYNELFEDVMEIVSDFDKWNGEIK
jgi:hypothetical protein